MNNKERVSGLAICCLVLIMMMVKPVYAYIDPGTGSAIFQGVLAAIAAVAITLKLYWHKILVLLGIRKKVHIPEKQLNTKKKSASDDANINKK